MLRGSPGRNLERRTCQRPLAWTGFHAFVGLPVQAAAGQRAACLAGIVASAKYMVILSGQPAQIVELVQCWRKQW
jgi:hypothetical protein